MCGFLGLLARPAGAGVARFDVARGSAALAHRGPDDAGCWQDPAQGIVLGHRRLAVIDLSPAGAQPMHSRCGRYVLVYNGEIYNHADLRARLAARGVALRGRSDTEILLECIALDGLEPTLRAANGMFALALWDGRDGELWLARDRLGEKPLYYGLADGDLVFASELKALHAALGATPPLDRAVLASYLRLGYVPDPACIFSGWHKLPAGNVLRIARRALPQLAQPQPYWTLDAVIARGAAAPLPDSPATVLPLLEACLQRAVAARLVADVPLGALLSGGIDSSLVVALMQRASARPVRTFTIGYAEHGYDESSHARAVARHLGTDHVEHHVGAEEARAVIPRLAEIYDEPFADSSQIPSLLVARVARGTVTTALTGDGGDELFAGYLRYGPALRAWQRLRALPALPRRAVLAFLAAPSPQAWDRLFDRLRPCLPAAWRYATPGDRLHKLARIGNAATLTALHEEVTALWSGPSLALNPAPASAAALDGTACAHEVMAMMRLDTLTYLPGDILTKLDRAAMAVSLETRVPFLDPEVVELAWRMPLALKLRHGQGKWCLRQLLARHLPPALFERPKMGFAVPLDSWLRGPLAAWAADCLADSRLRAAGHLDAGLVARLWREHRAGTHNHQHALWNVLMFESWRERWGVA